MSSRGRVLLWAVAVYGLATIGFGLSRAFWLTFFFLAATGAADTVSLVLRHIIRQVETPDQLRGRVMSLYSLCWNLLPLGGLIAGALAAAVSARFAVLFGGGVVAANAALLLTSRRLRRIA